VFSPRSFASSASPRPSRASSPIFQTARRQRSSAPREAAREGWTSRPLVDDDDDDVNVAARAVVVSRAISSDGSPENDAAGE
jgi:hypothetical protein